ncbi:MAG: hypothetical protein KJ957_06700 [Candidatus Omnitrophica bacterium]|nr:hypothetical protein [Candidatus Omnitrophota bacterium]
MFFRIIGLLWIILGIWWIMRPQTLRRRFTRKVKKTRRKLLFLIIILVAGLFLSAAKYTHGILANVFLIAGILGIIKAIFFITSKSAERILDWWVEKPLWLWRLWAACFVLIGFLFQKIR